MKKMNLFACMALSALTLASCSSDDDIIQGGDNQEVATGEQTIILDMQDTDVLASRSRPLYSTESKGAKYVTDVQLYVFKKGEQDATYGFVKKISHISNWDRISSTYNFGQQYSIKLKNDDRLTGEGEYMIIAVGQDEATTTVTPFKIQTGTTTSSVAELGDITNWPEDAAIFGNNMEAGASFLKTAALNYAEANKAAEIFSGISKPITFTINNGFTTTVLLTYIIHSPSTTQP